MINKNKLTKKIWFEDELWDVVKVISPNKHNDFILLKRKLSEQIYDDGTVATDMILIDAHNHTFALDKANIRDIMTDRIIRQGNSAQEDNVITKSWLSVVISEKI